ncbi:MAG: hypothetical protein HFF89_10250, partial [Oscillibacter sp.]|nr:hypothetical protein [Oscillibacter sp.]
MGRESVPLLSPLQGQAKKVSGDCGDLPVNVLRGAGRVSGGTVHNRP